MKNAHHPVAGGDYPRTFQEMDAWFGSEAGCRDYIQRLRWPDGFICRRCGATGEPWVTARGVLLCRACDGETSLTAGTVFLCSVALYGFGGRVLNDFAFCFVVGVLTGTYSSIYIASPVVLWFHRQEAAKASRAVAKKPQPAKA